MYIRTQRALAVGVSDGVNTKRILDNKLNKINEFGLYKEMPKEMLHSIIQWLIDEHYILKTKEKYPVLHSTYEGLHYSESITENKLKKLKKYLEEDVIFYNKY